MRHDFKSKSITLFVTVFTIAIILFIGYDGKDKLDENFVAKLDENFLAKLTRTPVCDEPEVTAIEKKCYDRHLFSRIEQRGNFWVMINYIPAQKTFRCHESITITANSDILFLENLVPAIERWNGPISLAVYAPGDDFYKALDSIAYLRNCQTDLIKKYVTFHIFFNVGHRPELINEVPLVNAYKDTYRCSDNPPYATTQTNDTYKHRKNLTYPINVGRNVAIEAVQTYFIFPLDIELYPSPKFIDKFLRMINADAQLLEQKLVYVLPHFEIVSKAVVPETKKELVKMYNNRSAFTFHSKVCNICHRLPRIEEWLELDGEEGGEERSEKGEDLGIFSLFKREKPFSELEPFFVSTIREPLFDERFFWEGAGDKLPQNLILCLLDYEYAILDDAFLVHKPGIKAASIQHKKYRKYMNSSNYLRKRIAKEELVPFYGNKTKCLTMH